MKSELSPNMRRAVSLARLNGGTLRRHPGGYWSLDEFHPGLGGTSDIPYVGTATVMGLIRRGLARVTQRAGLYRMPSEVAII